MIFISKFLWKGKFISWYDRPCAINEINKNINYILFIDENGNSNLDALKDKFVKNNGLQVEDRYFTITGCIFIINDYLNAKNQIHSLKIKYWDNGLYYDKKLKQKKAVCFHSRDIRRHDVCFNDELIDYENFINDLSITMKEINCKIISITIDLCKYLNDKYKHSVYNVTFDFLLERFIYNTCNLGKSIIVFEARGKKEDKELLSHVSKVINRTGTKKINSQELKRKILGVYFNPK